MRSIVLACFCLIVSAVVAEPIFDSNKPWYSGTLPVLFVDTENHVPIESKEMYVSATAYFDALGINDYTSLGTVDHPLKLEIKGRGNSSWKNYDKKPFRLKFEKKQPLAGMNKSRHYTLIPHVGGYRQYLTEVAGFEMGRMLEMAWTPAVEPIEVVLNGEYWGIYLLTEQIRVAETRVNIHEQSDEATDSDEITGGWLVEIDNYTDDAQVQFVSGDGKRMKITYKSPELLSPQQESYLLEQFTTIDKVIYGEDKASTLLWDKFIDIDALARYYIVQEILDNADAFRGSTYLHKDVGHEAKWVFGPLWDLGYSFWRTEKDFIYIDANYGGVHWIEEIAKFPQFQEKVKDIWRDFYINTYPAIYDFIDQFAQKCKDADSADAIRWPQYNKGDVMSKASSLKALLRKNTDWLSEQWSQSVSVLGNIEVDDFRVQVDGGVVAIVSENRIEYVRLYTLSGTCVPLQELGNGLYMLPVGITGLCVVEVVSDNCRNMIKCVIY